MAALKPVLVSLPCVVFYSHSGIREVVRKDFCLCGHEQCRGECSARTGLQRFWVPALLYR